SVVRGPWSVVRGPWSVVRGPWSVVRGPWSVVRGPWSVVRDHKCLLREEISHSLRQSQRSPSGHRKRCMPNRGNPVATMAKHPANSSLCIERILPAPLATGLPGRLQAPSVQSHAIAAGWPSRCKCRHDTSCKMGLPSDLICTGTAAHRSRPRRCGRRHRAQVVRSKNQVLATRLPALHQVTMDSSPYHTRRSPLATRLPPSLATRPSNVVNRPLADAPPMSIEIERGPY
ncbi:MAG: hypothetical protein RIQ53_570, partial [Pseudomonadota bacterium]